MPFSGGFWGGVRSDRALDSNLLSKDQKEKIFVLSIQAFC